MLSILFKLCATFHLDTMVQHTMPHSNLTINRCVLMMKKNFKSVYLWIWVRYDHLVFSVLLLQKALLRMRLELFNFLYNLRLVSTTVDCRYITFYVSFYKV